MTEDWAYPFKRTDKVIAIILLIVIQHFFRQREKGF